ncbi:MAG: AraC family transcriptional regulator [Bacteroidales bacterium]|nr:AraC family transcriptional regulator [Bacteroidales bacterium]
MDLNIQEILIVLTIFQLLVFSILLFTLTKGNRISNCFLGLFFFTLAFNIFNSLVFRLFDFFINNCIYLFYVGSSAALLYAPLFYFYILSQAPHKIGSSRIPILHLVPFALLTIYIVANFSRLPAQAKKEILLSGGLFSAVQYNVLVAVVHIQVFVYFILTMKKIKSYKLKYQVSSKTKHLCIKYILSGITCLWVIDLFRYISKLYITQIKVPVEISLYIGFIVFCFLFIQKIFSQPFMFHISENPTENKKQSLSDRIRKQYYQKLLACMNNEQPFLDPEINLSSLGQKISIPPRSLSEVINTMERKNFYDFINYYRIKESEKLLTTSSGREKTILEVLYEVGFNTKSAFNIAFKKHTGMTPTEYKRRNEFINPVKEKPLNCTQSCITG